MKQNLLKLPTPKESMKTLAWDVLQSFKRDKDKEIDWGFRFWCDVLGADTHVILKSLRW